MPPKSQAVVAALGNLSAAQVLERLKVGSATSTDWVVGSGARFCWLDDVRLCRMEQGALKKQLSTFSLQHAPPSLVRHPHCCPLVAHPPAPIATLAAIDCPSTDVSQEAKEELAGWLRVRLGAHGAEGGGTYCPPPRRMPSTMTRSMARRGSLPPDVPSTLFLHVHPPSQPPGRWAAFGRKHPIFPTWPGHIATLHRMRRGRPPLCRG
jgi:hypothetical protein